MSQSTYVVGGLTVKDADLIAAALDYYTNNILKVQDDTYDDLIVKFDSIATDVDETNVQMVVNGDIMNDGVLPQNSYTVEDNVINVNF